MSWLQRLNRIYDHGNYRLHGRRVTLPESEDCEINFESLEEGALILNFERLVDGRKANLGALLPKKCDLVAIYGSEASCHILLVEVKTGETRPFKTAREAADQLQSSKRIIEEAIPDCVVRVPNDLVWDAVVVSGSIDQQLMTRSEMPKIVAGFYTQTGILLRLVRCGDDVMAGVNGG